MDSDRDQSYFLFATTREQLRLLRFPLGEMSKPEVREHARRFGLAIADKPDSQDICFVPTGRYSDIVEKLAPQAAAPGEIVHVDGRVLGRHAGVMHYTIGQRRGLGLGSAAASAGEPLFVVKIDAAKARVTVGPRSALATKEVVLRDVNWIGPGTLDAAAASGLEIAVRVRSTRPPVPAVLESRNGEICVEFVDDESGVAPGQACVFYESAEPRARVLGGGFIRSAQAAIVAVEPPVARGDGMSEARREIAQLENAHVEEAYARWAPVYDLAFTAVMAPGRRAAVAAAQRRGGLILDVGVGTGLELPMFDPAVSVVGVDLSEPMLRRAQSRAASEKLKQVAGLCVMDATRLAFPSGHFDAVVAPFVLTVVPDPARDARRAGAGGEAGRRDRAGQSRRRRIGADRLGRKLARQEIRFARLAPGISMGDSRRLDRGAARHAPRRAPQDRAAGAVHAGADRADEIGRAFLDNGGGGGL